MNKNQPFLLFIGCGFSIAAGSPSWTQLRDKAIHEITGHLSRQGINNAWTQICEQAIKSVPEKEREQLLRFKEKPEFATWVLGEQLGGTWDLSRFFSRHFLPFPSINHLYTVQKVKEHNGLILTTEFDGHFAKALEFSSSNYKCTKFPAIQKHKDQRWIRIHEDKEHPYVIELHGSVNDHKSLACFPNHVTTWTSEESAEYIAKRIKDRHRAIFWGCGGEDPDIGVLFEHISKQRSPFTASAVIDLPKRKNTLLGTLGREKRSFLGTPKLKHIICYKKTSHTECWNAIMEFIRQGDKNK